MNNVQFPGKPRLGVNIDHVATLRNARGGLHPDPVDAARIAGEAGADGITAHLREDRRHIRDHDITRLRKEISLPLNFEMAATREMLEIALKVEPHACCLVPEKREEVTTEGGLDVLTQQSQLKSCIATLSQAGIRVSLFIDPDPLQVKAAAEMEAPVVELHTGAYCEAVLSEGMESTAAEREFERLRISAELAASLGLECHAGHGLNFDTARAVATIESFIEFNIGHFLIGQSIFSGLPSVVEKMHAALEDGRRFALTGGGP